MSFYFSPDNVLARRAARERNAKANAPQKPDVKHRTDIKNCTSCKHLVTCEMPKKSFDFKCNKYEMPKELSRGDYLAMVEVDVKEIEDAKEAEAEANDIINQLINQAIKDQEAGIQSDFTLEDEDLPTAKNFVDFYFNPRFSGEIKPVAKQIEICSDLFTEICYNPTCTDSAYAENMPTEATYDDILEKVTFLEHGICPKCSQTRFDMWSKYNRRKASTMVLCAGQRSGKDWTTGLALAYQDHRYLKLRDPGKALNMASGTMLYQTFTGIDFSQARKATFLPYVDFIEKSKWFQDYHAMLDHVGIKKGKKLYDIGKEAITWNYHGLASLVQSPDVRALRGVARRAYSITEIAYFYTKTKSAVRLDAEGIIEALQNSTAGVIAGFNRCIEQGKMDIPSPLTMIASSPRSVKDHVMQMLKLASKDDSIVARHYNTFEFNPNIKPDDLKSFRIKNPILYKTSILAIPQNAVSAFIPDRRLILNCMDEDRPNAVRGKQITVKAPSGAKLMSADIQILVKGVDRVSPKVLSLDAGYNRNSFAFTLAHTVIDVDDKTGVETRFTVVDALFEVIPTHSKPASYPDIYEQILVPICEELNVQLVVTDRYPGSIHMLQSFDKELGIQGMIRSAKYADFLYFRQCLLNATIDIPKMECDYKKAQELSQNNYPHSFEKHPVAHMLMQAITVEDQMGNKVDKGEGFTDDIFYSMVLAHAVCNDEELASEFLGVAVEQSSAEEVIGYRQGFDGNSASIEVRGVATQAKSNTVDLGVYVSYSG